MPFALLERRSHPLLAARDGWPLDHPYVEWCWTSRMGPTGILLARRVGALTRQGPARVDVEDLAGSLGVRGPVLMRTAHRLAQFGFGRGEVIADGPDAGSLRLAVYQRVPALSAHQVRQASPLVRTVHDHLVTTRHPHLEEPGRTSAGPVPGGSTDMLHGLGAAPDASLRAASAASASVRGAVARLVVTPPAGRQSLGL